MPSVAALVAAGLTAGAAAKVRHGTGSRTDPGAAMPAGGTSRVRSTTGHWRERTPGSGSIGRKTGLYFLYFDVRQTGVDRRAGNDHRRKNSRDETRWEIAVCWILLPAVLNSGLSYPKRTVADHTHAAETEARCRLLEAIRKTTTHIRKLSVRLDCELRTGHLPIPRCSRFRHPSNTGCSLDQ